MGRGQGGSTSHGKRTAGRIQTSSKMEMGQDHNTAISLTDQERQIFDVLKSVGDEHGITVRVAGGWVRDKLLGRPSKDIDVAVDKLSGVKFAHLVNEKLGGDDSNVAVIKANPDKSKHLETATMKIHDLPIDFAGLRTESYADPNSRVPDSIEVGTPEQDAARRDITINSMFYNLTNDKVEDFTGKGLEDLQRGVIRPSEDGTRNFLEDPLRVLRVIRLASRYGFDIPSDTMKAMSDPEVIEAFKNKLVPARFLKEVNEPLLTDPVRAVRAWLETGTSDVFIPGLRELDMDQKSKYHDKTVLEHTLALLDHIHKIDPQNLELKWAALLHDIGKPVAAKPNPGNPDQLQFIGHELESAKIAANVLRGFQVDKETSNKIIRLVAGHGTDANLDWSEQKFNTWMLNHFKTKEEWENWTKLREADIVASSPEYYDENMEHHKKIVERGNQVVDQVIGMKPYVDGNEIKQALGRDRPGKWIADVNERLLELQLGGRIKNKQDALDYLAKQELTEDGKLRKKESPKSHKPYILKDSGAFHNAIAQSKDAGLQEDIKQGTYGTKASKWVGAFVHTYSPEDYKDMKLINIANGRAGLAVKPSGDIVSVFKHPDFRVKDMLSTLIPEALVQGGNHLDCFNGYLPSAYALYGFKPVARLKFNREYAPEHWNYERDGEPDVIFMAHDGRSVADVRADVTKMRKMSEQERAQYRDEVKRQVNKMIEAVPEVSSYDEAEKLQLAALHKS